MPLYLIDQICTRTACVEAASKADAIEKADYDLDWEDEIVEYQVHDKAPVTTRSIGESRVIWFSIPLIWGMTIQAVITAVLTRMAWIVPTWRQQLLVGLFYLIVMGILYFLAKCKLAGRLL